LAEIAGEYVKKGRPIYVEGRLKYGVYTDKTTGVEKNTVDIIATELQLLGGREGMGGPSGGGEDGGYSRPAAQRPAAPAAQRPAAAAPAKGGFDDMDDDIPF
jgi:single-strand DNA-binding protein